MTAAFWHYSSKNDSWYISSSLQEALSLNNSPKLTELLSLIPDANRFSVLRQFKNLFMGKQADGSIETTLFSPNNKALQVKTDMKRIYGYHGDIQIEGTVDFVKNRSSFLQIPSVAEIVYENTSEGILVTDANGYIVSVNDWFCRITGYSYAEVIGKRPSILKSNRQGKDFYQKLWQSTMCDGAWTGTLWNKKKTAHYLFPFKILVKFRQTTSP